jgi:hypothetical protein
MAKKASSPASVTAAPQIPITITRVLASSSRILRAA